MRYKTLSIRQMEREDAKARKYGDGSWFSEDPDDMPKKPVIRADCASVPRPCPWASCRYNLAIEVGARGSIKSLVPDNGEEIPSCALDVAAKGPTSLQTIGRIFGLTPERIRQEEERALLNLKQANVLADEPPGDFYTQPEYTEEPNHERGDTWTSQDYSNPEWMDQALSQWNMSEN